MDYVEDLAKHGLPWPDPLAKNLELHHLEMEGVLPEPQAHLVMDEWIVYVQQTLHRLLDVTVPLEVLSKVLSEIVPLNIAPTRAKCHEHIEVTILALKAGRPNPGTPAVARHHVRSGGGPSSYAGPGRGDAGPQERGPEPLVAGA